MNNSRSISINGKEVNIRGLYWGELDESSRAGLKDAVSLLDDVNVDALERLMERSESTPTEASAEGKALKGLHKGTLLRCGVVDIDGDEVGVAEFIRTLNGKQAEELAQAIADLTVLADDEGNLESK